MPNVKKDKVQIILWAVSLLWGPLVFAADINPLFRSSYDYSLVRVQKVISADTFILENDERVKLIGLQALEPPRRKEVQRDKYGFIIEENTPESSLQDRAFQFAKDYLEGKKIRLEFDVDRKSEDYATLAYAFMGDTFINAEILRQGYADLRIKPPNLKYTDALRRAYREARQEKRGLHAE